jgi:hypothetical protein
LHKGHNHDRLDFHLVNNLIIPTAFHYPQAKASLIKSEDMKLWLITITLIIVGISAIVFLPYKGVPEAVGALYSAWTYFDSLKLRVENYRSKIFSSPFKTAFFILLAWPIFLPLYMVHRQNIKNGKVQFR